MLFRVLLMLHLLGVGATVGTAMFMAALGAAAGGKPEVMRPAAATAERVGGIGLGLLWVTGLWMAFGFGLYQGGGLWFDIKVVLTVVLTILVVLTVRNQRAARKPNANLAAVARTARRLGPANLLTAIAIVICAVSAFR